MESDAGLTAHVESSNALWSVHFVRTDRQKVNIHIVDIDRNFTDALSSIRMEEYFVFATNLSNLTDWLHNADFVVDMDDGADQGVWPDSTPEHFEVNEALRSHWQISDLKSLVFQLAARI